MIWLPAATHHLSRVGIKFKEGVHERQRTPLPARRFDNLDRLTHDTIAQSLFQIEKIIQGIHSRPSRKHYKATYM